MVALNMSSHGKNHIEKTKRQAQIPINRRRNPRQLTRITAIRAGTEILASTNAVDCYDRSFPMLAEYGTLNSHAKLKMSSIRKPPGENPVSHAEYPLLSISSQTSALATTVIVHTLT